MATLRLLGLVLVLMLGPLPVSAAQGDPEGYIRGFADKALALVTDRSASLPDQRARFDALLTEHFDLEGIGRFLLGRYWRLATDEEREAYHKAFKESLVYTYTARFGEYGGQTLQVDGSREDGRFLLVQSRIVDPAGSAPVRLDWRLLPTGDSFKIIDVVIEGVSMSLTQRQEYASVIQANGGDVTALINALNKRMSELKASGG